MSRKSIFLILGFLGALLGFAAALPARSGPAAHHPPPVGTEVPLEWVARALAEMPFNLPPAR